MHGAEPERYVNKLLKAPQEAEDKVKSAEKAQCAGNVHEHFEALSSAVSCFLRGFQQFVQEGGGVHPGDSANYVVAAVCDGVGIFLRTRRHYYGGNGTGLDSITVSRHAFRRTGESE